MFGSNKEHKSWCGCCDGNDDKCRCIHHGPWIWYFVKGVIMLVVLVFVFAAGVWVGKLSSWWHMHKAYYGTEYRMMKPGQQQMMQNSQYQWPR